MVAWVVVVVVWGKYGDGDVVDDVWWHGWWWWWYGECIEMGDLVDNGWW